MVNNMYYEWEGRNVDHHTLRPLATPWWRHQMEVFSALLVICAGKFTGSRWISRTKASDVELWCFFDLRPNKRLSKQSWSWWFETPSCPFWRHSNGKPPPTPAQSKKTVRTFLCTRANASGSEATLINMGNYITKIHKEILLMHPRSYARNLLFFVCLVVV